MAYTLDLTQSQTLTVLRSFLIALSGYDPKYVVQGQSNRVAAPTATNYIVFTPLTRTRLATNVVKYSSTATLLNQHTLTQSAMLPVQVDCYGPQSSDLSQVISTEFRSSDAIDFFATAGLEVTPLYTSDPRQIPFSDEGDQIQMRWSLDCQLQIKPGVTSGQQFADSLAIGIQNIDVFYPPT